MAYQFRVAGVKPPERQARLIEGRKFQTDFCWRDEKVVLEVEGGTWRAGRHTSGSGFERDCLKYNTLGLNGWLVLRVTSGQVKSGEALDWVIQALILRRR